MIAAKISLWDSLLWAIFCSDWFSGKNNSTKLNSFLWDLF